MDENNTIYDAEDFQKPSDHRQRIIHGKAGITTDKEGYWRAVKGLWQESSTQDTNLACLGYCIAHTA